MSVASFTTWLLVRTYPSPLSRKPEPSDAPLELLGHLRLRPGPGAEVALEELVEVVAALPLRPLRPPPDLRVLHRAWWWRC